MSLADPVFVAQGAFSRLREMHALLTRASIPSEIVGPPDGKTNA